MAEIANKPPEGGFSDDPAVNTLQAEVYNRRRAGITQKLSSFDEQILQIAAEIRTNVQDAEDLGEQAEVLRELEAMRLKLLDEGHGSRVTYLTAKHQRLSVDREQRRLVSTRTRMEHQLKGLRADRGATLAEWRSRSAQELVETRRERVSVIKTFGTSGPVF